MNLGINKIVKRTVKQTQMVYIMVYNIAFLCACFPLDSHDVYNDRIDGFFFYMCTPCKEHH